MFYDPSKIEPKWQEYWAKNKTFKPKDFEAKRKKFYHLVMFAYPSGDLHMGHWYNFAPADTYARFKFMQGFNVFSPIGFDAFGLPAENAAIVNKLDPATWTKDNIERMRKQLRSIGPIYDWDREVLTNDPGYYRWTQWIFLQLYKKGLAYRTKALANWCPSCQTVLANEQVIAGHCERCETEVLQKEIDQWLFKITAYADRLLKDLDKLDWPERTKTSQRNWIGRSVGRSIEFPIVQKNIKKFVLIHGFTDSGVGKFRPWLKRELEKQGFKVVSPTMPNTSDPDVNEQAQFIIDTAKPDEHNVLVGHSLGGAVALKILEKGVKVNGVVLVGAPYRYDDFLDIKTKPRPPVKRELAKGFKWNSIKKNATFFTVLSDRNDYVVPKSHGKVFSEKLNGQLIEVNAEKPHFLSNQEPTVLDACTPTLKIFTTRPDTIKGVTYMVLAPEYPLVQQITTKERKSAVQEYIQKAKRKTERERQMYDKSGVFTGTYAMNPVTKEEVPVWVADYVLMGYGTGAIMAVPMHDERDKEFAQANNLLLGSGELIDPKGIGKPQVNYRLRDWIVSRQRYWGVPIPIIYCGKCGTQPVPEDQLPVLLPKIKDYLPKGKPPLATASKDWLETTCPNCQGKATREVETMDTFVDSSWYFLRYTDPRNEKRFADAKLVNYWCPVDSYIGGAEHTVMHLLYARFITKVLKDLGQIEFDEPFSMLRHQGTILGPDRQKMSKSRGNVIDPDEIVKKFGSDTVRMFLMFMGPYDQGGPWSPSGIAGIFRFLKRLAAVSDRLSDEKATHVTSHVSTHMTERTLAKVTDDLEKLHFNTAIAALMSLLNHLETLKSVPRAGYRKFLIMLAPFAPHLAEELWAKNGGKQSIFKTSWPKADQSKLRSERVLYIVQVNGKLRAKITLPPGTPEDKVIEQARSDQKVADLLKGKKVVKTIHVPSRLVNFVV